ncbi:hypothetical protein [Hymenobacter psychrophilus]|uniref:hypothetical protein n=1 Tax=Hymenobacter psychrophilus TaxID=651662 RepID=UPI000B805B2E|nr:hypothetical protein [Hymenobacter psychrophilus]
MIKRLDQAIEKQNEQELQACIADLFNQTEQIDKAYYPKIERLLLEKWHHEHEDIIGLIWLKELKDDRFIDPIMLIAQQGEIYRSYDDGLESTLRKCVHVLKKIATELSNSAIKKLIDTGNENVKYALENYR